MVTPSNLKEHSSCLLIGSATSEPHIPVHLYDSQKKRWNWDFPSGNSTTENGLSNESQIALFFNIISTAVANSRTDHAISSSRRRIWMADWSSRCLSGSTGYNRKPDLVLVSNSITSRDEITWLTPKVIGEYSGESFQPASRMGKTMDTKAYLVMVDQPWRRFVLGLSLANEELRVHFYDRSGGSITPPFNIHAEPDSFLYILSALVFGIQTCIGFDRTIKISPPPINTRRQVKAISPPQTPSLLDSQLPLTTDAPPLESQPLCTNNPPSLPLEPQPNTDLPPLESQPDQVPLPVFRPVPPVPEPLSSSPEATPSIGTIHISKPALSLSRDDSIPRATPPCPACLGLWLSSHYL